MTEIIKTNAPIILAEIKKAQSILLHCHPSPDPDSVGSALAMKLALEQLGKKVTLIKGDSDIPKAFEFPGVETIVQKNFFETNIQEFDLFIILDSGSPEMISSKDKIVFPDSLTTIVIDHHASNIGYGKINCIDSSYPATAQILFDLFKEIGVRLNHDIALNLFMGIYTDTGGFRYNSVTADTFRIATDLVSLAPDFTKTISIMDNSKRKESLVFEGIALSSMKTFFDGKFAIASVNYEELEKNNIVEGDISTGYISSKIKSIIGVDASATLIESKPKIVKVSFRTRDQEKYDVSKLAVALGGGGHKGASGAKLNMTMSEAIDLVVKTAKEIYNL